MAFLWIIPLSAAMACFALATLVNRRGPSGQLSQVFTFLSSMLVFWNLNFFVLYSISNYKLAFDLARTFRMGAFFLAPALLHLLVALGEERSKVWRYVLVVDYLVACMLAAVNTVDLFVYELRTFAWGYYSVGTKFYNVFSVLLVTNFVLVSALLAYDYRTSAEPRRRQQLTFWMLGAVVALPLGLTNLLPAYGVPFYPLGNLGSVVWAGIVAYAIVRHRLLDIDLAVTKGMAYAVVSVVLIAPAWVLTLWLQRLSFGQVRPDFSFAILLMFVAVGLLFPTLRLRAQSRIGQSLFREKYEYRAALGMFTRSIVRILDRDKLIQELANTLSETLQLEGIAVALGDDSRTVFSVRYAVGVPAASAEFSRNHPLVTSLIRRQQAVLRDELEASADSSERAEVAEICRRNGWEVCIPLTAAGKLVGFISLGRKRTLSAFSAEDLDLLETLGAEAAVALENARLYEELRKSQDIIRRADRLSALGTLAAGIAHEVRNPLVSIQTFFQLAPERLHDEEFFTTFLSMTANEVKRISDLITELLSFARSPTRALRAVDLNETVERVATLLEPEARKHKLALRRSLSPAVPLVQADADQVKQVLINLVLNAIQATPPEGTISVTSRPVDHRGAAFGQVEIHDTGVGIPADQIDHIFDPFFTTKDKGTGLGLAIAHQIISEHGGAITVESREGNGASFFIDLPAAEGSVGGEPLVEEPPDPGLVGHRYDRQRQVAS